MEEREALIEDFMKLFASMKPAMPKKDEKSTITHKETALLFLLAEAEKESLGFKPSEIGCKFGIAPPTVTQMVNSLEEQGLVERNYDSSDRRAVYIKCTEEGRRVEKISKEYHVQFIGEMVDYLGIQESKEFKKSLEKLKAFFKSKQQNSCGGSPEC